LHRREPTRNTEKTGSDDRIDVGKGRKQDNVLLKKPEGPSRKKGPHGGERENSSPQREEEKKRRASRSTQGKQKKGKKKGNGCPGKQKKKSWGGSAEKKGERGLFFPLIPADAQEGFCSATKRGTQRGRKAGQ